MSTTELQNPTPTPTELACVHLECALALKGTTFIQTWLTEKQSGAAPMNSLPVSKRGRKPGAAPIDARCAWVSPNGSQCKNHRADNSTACGIHVNKIHLINAAASQ